MSTNRGVYTNTSHDLYVADAEPLADTILSGSTLEPGEVTVAIKSSGICGLEYHIPLTYHPPSNQNLDRTSISGNTAVLVPGKSPAHTF